MTKPLNHHHGGHRHRMRMKLENNIAHSLNDHELLEMLLYYVYPRCDTNEKAHILLEHFGGKLSSVLEADSQSLINAGLTEVSASFFLLLREINRSYNLSKLKGDFTFDDYDALFRYCESLISDPLREECYVICFNSKGRRICDVPAPVGMMQNVHVSMRRIMDIVVKNNAYSVVLVHNHPNGMPTASLEDIAATQFIDKVLRPVNVFFADHIIVTNGEATSMRLNGHFDVNVGSGQYGNM